MVKKIEIDESEQRNQLLFQNQLMEHKARKLEMNNKLF